MQDQAIIDGCSRTMTCTVKDQTELLAISKSVSILYHMLDIQLQASNIQPKHLFYRTTWICHFAKQGSATRKQNTLPSASVYMHS